MFITLPLGVCLNLLHLVTVVSMYTKKHKPNYVNFSGMVSNTIPGRCYSIRELLARVVRGERLPGLDSANEVDNSPVVDWDNPDVAQKEYESIEKEFSRNEANPAFYGDFDEADASQYIQEQNALYGL